jgi:uncharacterized SAM-binding protein YcdF (DUF218 family)
LGLIRKIVLLAGVLALIYGGLAFTTLPYWGLHWLGTSGEEEVCTPDVIIMLGGSGMPSESNLMRSWYTARAALSFPEVPVVVVMPGDPADAGSTPALIRKELMIRGVDSSRILFENVGTNTRSQALACAVMLERSIPVMMAKDLPAIEEKNLPGFPDDSLGGRVDRSLPGFPDDTLRGRVDRSLPGFPDDTLRGRVDRSLPGLPDDSLGGRVDRSLPGFPDDTLRGRVDRSLPGFPDDSLGGRVDRSRPGFPDDSLVNRAEKRLPVMLVTSPEHMRRSLLCFRKAGFEQVCGLSAFENAAEADFSFRDDDLGRNPVLVPDVGSNLQLRYQVWTHLRYEIMFTREMLALVYYRLRGWT